MDRDKLIAALRSGHVTHEVASEAANLLVLFAQQPTGIMQPWVRTIGLRHQGVLVSIIRGCDDEPRNSKTKMLTRCIREVLLVPHCLDSAKASTFIEKVDDAELQRRMDDVRRDLDHLPHHFVMHLIHAIEIIGYKHPNSAIAGIWLSYYERLVRCFHMNPETEQQLDERLNRDEEAFAREAMRTNGLPVASEVRLRNAEDMTEL